LNYLRGTENSSLKINRLANGDYLLNNLTVERKTFPDFVQSIKDGRLFQQASCLSSLNNPCMMILEGTFKDVFKTKMKREAIQDALVTLELIFRIPVLRSASPEDSARIMIYAANQICKHEMGRWSYKRPVKKGISKSNTYRNQIQILQGFPLVGPVKAEGLLIELNPLNKIFNASPTQIFRTPDIGMGLAEQIYKIVNEKVI